MPEPTCALWYWRHYVVQVDLCDTEEEAVREALAMVDQESGSPDGIQYSDGRYVNRDDWTAYHAESRRRSEKFQEMLRDALPYVEPPTRSVPAPWDPTKKVSIPEDAPSWLGAQPEEG